MTNYPIGVSVQEGVSAGFTPFGDTSKYGIGIIFERERGIPNVAIPIMSLQEDRKRFGGIESTKFGAYISRHLFKNAQNYGAIMYGVRILDVVNSSAATGVLTDGKSTPTTILNIWAGQNGQKDLGTWSNGSNGVKVRCYPKNHALGAVDAYTFQVFYKNELVETWEASTWVSLISQVNERSGYVMLIPNDLTESITDVQNITLAGGTYTAPVEEDYYPIPDEIAPTGLAVFDSVDIQMLACAELTTLTFAQVARDYANLHPNRPMFIYSLPYQSTTSVVTTFATGMQTASTDCSAGYNFWVKTSDESDGFTWTPSVGVILGAGFVRVAGMNRDLIHFPPASIESAFVDVIDISPNNVTLQTATQWVKRYSTNVAIFQKGIGFFLFSSRTNSTNILFQSIHIRRVTSYYLKQLEANLLWTIQKPITAELKRQVYTSLYTYFYQEWSNGALENSIPFEQACSISIGQDTNDRKNLVVDISYILTECAESIRINLNRNDNSLIGKIA